MPTRRAALARFRTPRTWAVATARGWRAAAGAVGIAVGATLGIAVLIRSGLWQLAVAMSVGTLVAGAAWGGHRIRRMRAHIEAGYQGRIAALRKGQDSLALAVYDLVTGRQEKPVLPAALVPAVVRSLLERGDALDAHALAIGSDALPQLDLSTLRRLRGALKRRGYLMNALHVADACVARSTEARDRHQRDLIKGTVTVLTRSALPALRHPGAVPAPVAGRVLHVVSRSLPYEQMGYMLRTHYTALAQRTAGLEPHVVTQMGFAHGGGDGSATGEVDGIPHHRIPGPVRGSQPLDVWLDGYVEGLADVVRTVRPAVLHAASDFHNALAAEVVGDALGLPVVYESRGFWEETSLSRRAQEFGWELQSLARRYGLPDEYLWRRELEDRCRRKADLVVTLAQGMADRIEAGGVPRDHIAVGPNAVDTTAFPVLGRSAPLAARLGIIEPETIVIGYISTLKEYEGVDTLLTAFAGLPDTDPAGAAKLLVVGDGPELESLRGLAIDLGVADRALLPGRADHAEILEYYSLIDIFVVPRRPTEVCHLVTPLKPFEAFATGRTVVLSNVRALVDLAEQSGAAELFEAGDPASLRSVLMSLLLDPQRRQRLAAAGAAWVRRERTWAANATAYLELYRRIGVRLDGRTPPLP